MKKSKAILICLIFSFFYAIISWFIIILPFKTFKNDLDNLPTIINDSFLSRYPEDLLISIQKGQVGLNRDSPYCFILDKNSNMGLIYDDTVSSADPTVFNKGGPYDNLCHPIALVSQTFFMYQDSSSKQIKISQIPQDVNYQIKKSTITTFVDKVIPNVVKIGNIAYFVIPVIIFISFFLFTLLTNFWYSFVANFALTKFKIDTSPVKSFVYGSSLFVFNIIQFINLVLFAWLANKFLGQSFYLSFPFSKTILITLGVVAIYKYAKPKTPKETVKATPLVSDPPPQAV